MIIDASSRLVKIGIWRLIRALDPISLIKMCWLNEYNKSLTILTDQGRQAMGSDFKDFMNEN